MTSHRACVGAVLLLALAGSARSAMPLLAKQATDVPVFTVDTAWPKPLPNNWAVGPVSGLATDSRDHIWLIHRGEAVKERTPAPPVIEFDQAGSVVQTWGGPGTGYEWPQQVHGITIDAKDRVWISGNGEKDNQILVFTRAGKFLRQIGRAGKNGGNSDTENVARATQMRLDPGTNEVFVSDGESNQHHRVIVFDSETGAYKRHWGAYGAKPDDAAATAKSDRSGPPPKHFGTAVHCLRVDRNNLVYVCDRSNNRVQIFRKDGTFQNEFFVARDSGAAGTATISSFRPITSTCMSPMAGIRRCGSSFATACACSARLASAVRPRGSSPRHFTI